MKRRPSRTPRKTPRQARSRDTFDTILEATARILETAGLERTNTNAIATRAGISVGSLYQYFPDKDAIFAELVRRHEVATADALAALVAGTTDLPFTARIEALARAAVAQQFARPRLGRILDYLEATMGADDALTAADQRIIGLLADLLHAHRESFARAPTREAARDLMWIAKGMIDGASVAGESDTAALERRVVDAVLGYLRAG